MDKVLHVLPMNKMSGAERMALSTLDFDQEIGIN